MFKGVIYVGYFFLQHWNTGRSKSRHNLLCHSPHHCDLPLLLLLCLLRLFPACCVVLQGGVCHIENLVFEVCQSPPDVLIQYQLVTIERANLTSAGEKPPLGQLSLTLLSRQEDAAGAEVVQADLLVLDNFLGGKESHSFGLSGAFLESVCPTGMVDPGQSGIDCMELLTLQPNVDPVGIENPPSLFTVGITQCLVTGRAGVDTGIVQRQQLIPLSTLVVPVSIVF